MIKETSNGGLNSALRYWTISFYHLQMGVEVFVFVDIKEENEYVIGDLYLKSFDSDIYGSRGVFYDDM